MLTERTNVYTSNQKISMNNLYSGYLFAGFLQFTSKNELIQYQIHLSVDENGVILTHLKTNTKKRHIIHDRFYCLHPGTSRCTMHCYRIYRLHMRQMPEETTRVYLMEIENQIQLTDVAKKMIQYLHKQMNTFKIRQLVVRNINAQ